MKSAKSGLGELVEFEDDFGFCDERGPLGLEFDDDAEGHAELVGSQVSEALGETAPGSQRERLCSAGERRTARSSASGV